MNASAHKLEFPEVAIAANALPAGYLANRRLLTANGPVLLRLQWLASTAAVVGSLCIIVLARNGEVSEIYRALAVFTVLLMAVVHHTLGLSMRQDTQWSGIWRVAVVWTSTFCLILLCGFLTKTSKLFSHQIIAVWFATAFAAQCVILIACNGLCRFCKRHLKLGIPSAVIGSGWLAARLAHCINSDPLAADQVIGVIDEPEALKNWHEDDLPVLSNLDELESVVTSGVLDRIYIALPFERSNEVTLLQMRLLQHNIDVIWVPDIFSINVVNPSVREISVMPLLSLTERPVSTGTRAYLKSLLDVLGATLAIIVFSPLMLAVVAAIKLTSTGPAFYRQTRAGWDGEPFEIWKFRTMHVHDEGSLQLTQALKNDPRITSIGRFLRQSSIDELPQLFNVLKGTMSLVGPRPHSIIHDHDYRGQVQAYLHRHRIKPGMTGWAQINGLRGEIHSVEDMIRRVEFDLDYINRWSLHRDLWILLRTPFALFSRNAY